MAVFHSSGNDNVGWLIPRSVNREGSLGRITVALPESDARLKGVYHYYYFLGVFFEFEVWPSLRWVKYKYGGPIGEVFRKFRCLRTEICVVRENIFNVRRKKYLPKYIYH